MEKADKRTKLSQNTAINYTTTYFEWQTCIWSIGICRHYTNVRSRSGRELDTRLGAGPIDFNGTNWASWSHEELQIPLTIYAPNRFTYWLLCSQFSMNMACALVWCRSIGKKMEKMFRILYSLWCSNVWKLSSTWNLFEWSKKS